MVMLTGDPDEMLLEDGKIVSHEFWGFVEYAKVTGLVLAVVRLTVRKSPPPWNEVLKVTGFTSTPRSVLPPPPVTVLLPFTAIVWVSVGVPVLVTLKEEPE